MFGGLGVLGFRARGWRFAGSGCQVGRNKDKDHSLGLGFFFFFFGGGGGGFGFIGLIGFIGF